MIVNPVSRFLRISPNVTIVTPRHKVVLIILGLCHILFAGIAIGLEVELLVNADSAYYRGFWVGALFLVIGIGMLFISCKPAYITSRIKSIFITLLTLCIIGLILSIVSLLIATKCSDHPFTDFCDSQFVTTLKEIILAFYIVAVIYTMATAIMIHKAGTNSALTQPLLPH